MAVSLDGVAVGAAYGAVRLLIPVASLVLVGVSAAVLALAGGLAGVTGGVLAAGRARTMGALLLLVLGVLHLARARRLTRGEWSGRRGRGDGAPAAAGADAGGGAAPFYAEPRLLLRVRLLNLAVHVVLEPETADVDRSGRLEAGEALLVGLSLGLDGAAAGLAAGMAEAGSTLFLAGFPLLVGVFQVAALACGWRLGRRRLPPPLAAGFGYLPGAALVGLALARLLIAR